MKPCACAGVSRRSRPRSAPSAAIASPRRGGRRRRPASWVGKSGPVLPGTKAQLDAIDEPGASEAYTLAYRALSPDTHAGARAFLHGGLERHPDGTASYRDEVSPRRRAAGASVGADDVRVDTGARQRFTRP